MKKKERLCAWCWGEIPVDPRDPKRKAKFCSTRCSVSDRQGSDRHYGRITRGEDASGIAGRAR